MKNKIKHYAIIALVVVNIAIGGAVFGFVQGMSYEKGNNKQIQQTATQLLKSVPVAQAASK